jgi:membrane protein DedA with SNARE-associated domain
VPIAAIFFAVGALIGLGSLDPGYTIASAAAGAFCGDALSYAVGRRFGDGMKQLWPFCRHPQWIEGGERFLQRHGNKGIVIARYVGAVRPFVPAIVGMARLPFARYAPASAFACVTWAILFLAPGWLFGASVELLQAIGSRLLVVVIVLIGSLLLIAWLVHSLYALLAPRAEAWAEAALGWSRRHRWLGRLTRPLVDPNVPESTSVAALALLLLLAASGFFWLLGAMTGGVAPLAIDLQFRQAMYGLRTPLADPLLAFFSTLGDWTGCARRPALAALAPTFRGRGALDRGGRLRGRGDAPDRAPFRDATAAGREHGRLQFPRRAGDRSHHRIRFFRGVDRPRTSRTQPRLAVSAGSGPGDRRGVRAPVLRRPLAE